MGYGIWDSYSKLEPAKEDHIMVPSKQRTIWSPVRLHILSRPPSSWACHGSPMALRCHSPYPQKRIPRSRGWRKPNGKYWTKTWSFPPGKQQILISGQISVRKEGTTFHPHHCHHRNHCRHHRHHHPRCFPHCCCCCCIPGRYRTVCLQIFWHFNTYIGSILNLGSLSAQKQN